MTWKKTRKWARNKLLEKLYPVRGRFHSLVRANFHFHHHHHQEIIKSSNIVIFEPRFDRSAERTRRMSRPLLNSLADVPPLGGSVQDNTEHLVIRRFHYRHDCGNESSLCMERIWVLLQVYMNIDVILLLDNFWMKLDRYMCVQTLGGMYNTGWPINEIHYALQHPSCRLHCRSLPLIIFKS